MVTWTIFQNPPLGDTRLGTQLGDHGTQKPHNRSIYVTTFYHERGPCVNWNSLWQQSVEGAITYDFITPTFGGMWPHYMILEVPFDGLWTLLLGSRSFVVTALVLCVQWLIGGKGRAGPSSLHTIARGTNKVSEIQDECLHGIKWIKFHDRLDYFPKTTSWQY